MKHPKSFNKNTATAISDKSNIQQSLPSLPTLNKQHIRLIGFHAIEARLKQNPSSITCVYLSEKRILKQEKRMQALFEQIKEHTISFELVEEEALQHISQKHQGVIAYAQQNKMISSLEELFEHLDNQTKKPHLLLLDEVTDPHNLGACLRVADACGMDAILIPKQGSIKVNETVAKVASGASEYIPVIEVVNLSRTIEQLQDYGIWVIGTSDKAQTNLYQTKLNVPLAWVMGAEGKGIKAIVQKHCDELISIPMQGQVNSLNVSVASSVCAFEALRQRLAQSS